MEGNAKGGASDHFEATGHIMKTNRIKGSVRLGRLALIELTGQQAWGRLGMGPHLFF